VVGYGEAELTIVVTSVVPASVAHCGFALAVSGTATIELEDDSTLVLDETGTYCLPGGSHFAPGNFFVSYGNPLEIEATIRSSAVRASSPEPLAPGRTAFIRRETRRWPSTGERCRSTEP
jgi:hypothetical protein